MADASVCPICGKPPDAKVRPFCSRRCADVDLYRWLAGVYTLPAQEDDEMEEQPGAAPRARQKRD
jgi:endogenous inhibitor of DNA gyrase (YacG/DUF329 family)